jgi:hypothetical protein
MGFLTVVKNPTPSVNPQAIEEILFAGMKISEDTFNESWKQWVVFR